MAKFLSLYVNACRTVMRFDVRDSASLTELTSSLVAARHAMICCVCGRLLKSPTGPAQSTCYHYFCRNCVGGKTKYMKGGCGWCKDATEFVADPHLESVIRCFRQLCVYLNSLISPAARNGHEMDTVLAIIREAVEKRDLNDDILIASPASPSDRRPNMASLSLAVTSLDVSKISHFTHQETLKSNSHVNLSTTKRRRKPQTVESPRKHHKSHSQTCVPASRCSVGVYPLSSTDGNVSDLQLGNSLMDAMPWSDGVDHSRLNDADQHVDVEETLASGIYDARWSLLENPILAEHDYNKLTSFNAVNSVSAPAILSVPSSKLSKSSTAKKSSSKRSSVDKGSTVRKPSLTIRQLSEGNSSGVGIGLKISEGSVDSSVPRRQKSSGPKVKIGCRCAMATPAPGKLTCCGQRCPCYAAFHGCCPSCKCRGCRNPRGDPAKSPLIGTAVKTSSADHVQQCNLFDSTGAVYGSISKDHIVMHSPSRFTAESVSC